LFAESAKLANAALANSLAVSEKDLAEAKAAREKSERECDALRKHVVRLEDKASFLSAKLKEMSAELQSGHAYIDKLYADLQQIETSYEDLKVNFERRELEWTELERGYSQRIRELEDKYGSESKNNVSLEAYMTAVKQTRHYKAEATKNQETIDSLKERLAAGKAMRALQVIGVSKPIVHCNNSQIEQQGGVVSKSDTQQGKHLNRVAVIKAAGGRKGLTEQLKKARGVSPKANNVPL
jgi:chromosome segregation ATPase